MPATTCQKHMRRIRRAFRREGVVVLPAEFRLFLLIPIFLLSLIPLYFIVSPIFDVFIIFNKIESNKYSSIKSEISFPNFMYAPLPLLIFTEMAISLIYMQPMKLRFWWIILTIIFFLSLGAYRDLKVHDVLRDSGYTSCIELLTGVKGGASNARYALSPEACLSARVPPPQTPSPVPRKNPP